MNCADSNPAVTINARDARMNLKLGGGQNMCFYTMQKMPEFCFIAYT